MFYSLFAVSKTIRPKTCVFSIVVGHKLSFFLFVVSPDLFGKACHGSSGCKLLIFLLPRYVNWLVHKTVTFRIMFRPIILKYRKCVIALAHAWGARNKNLLFLAVCFYDFEIWFPWTCFFNIFWMWLYLVSIIFQLLTFNF